MNLRAKVIAYIKRGSVRILIQIKLTALSWGAELIYQIQAFELSLRVWSYGVVNLNHMFLISILQQI